MPFFTIVRFCAISAIKKAALRGCCSAEDGRFSRGTPSICPSLARKDLNGIRCHTPGAVSGAPVFAYHLRFSKPLGKEFAAPASAASHQYAAL